MVFCACCFLRILQPGSSLLSLASFEASSDIADKPYAVLDLLPINLLPIYHQPRRDQTEFAHDMHVQLGGFSLHKIRGKPNADAARMLGSSTC